VDEEIKDRRASFPREKKKQTRRTRGRQKEKHEHHLHEVLRPIPNPKPLEPLGGMSLRAMVDRVLRATLFPYPSRAVYGEDQIGWISFRLVAALQLYEFSPTAHSRSREADAID
jgi:hypothetical protein